MTEVAAPFRVAVRDEGDAVKIYIALHGTMKDAIPVAIINRHAVDSDKCHAAVLALATAMGECLCTNVLGVEPIDMMVSPAMPEQDASRPT